MVIRSKLDVDRLLEVIFVLALLKKLHGKTQQNTKKFTEQQFWVKFIFFFIEIHITRKNLIFLLNSYSDDCET